MLNMNSQPAKLMALWRIFQTYFEFIFEFKITIYFEFNLEIFVNFEFNFVISVNLNINFEIFVNVEFIFQCFLSISSFLSVADEVTMLFEIP